MTCEIDNRKAGVALLLTSAITYSTAGLFAKGVSADAYTIIFWRGLSSAGLLLAYLRWRGRGAIRAELGAMGYSGWAVALAASAGTAAFIPAFKYTTVANVALLYAAAPFAAAGFAWLWMREAPAKRTIIASTAALGGVAVIVGGSVTSPNLIGDLLALWMTLSMAIIFVIYRRHPKTPTSLPMIASSLILAALAATVTDVLRPPPGEIPIMLGFGLVHAVAFVTLAEGARFLPAADAGLLSALETPLAPVWAWLFLQERPGMETIVGGGIIMAAVFWASRSGPKQDPSPTAATPAKPVSGRR